MKLAGRVAIVTGAARGLGAAFVRYLASEGAKVAVLDIGRNIGSISPLATGDQQATVVDALIAMGSEAIAVEADVRSSQQMQSAVDRVMQEWGRIDILVNNAGVCVVEPIDEISDESLDAVIDVNVKGTFNAMRKVIPVMKRQRYGKVINIASAGGVKPLANVSNYAASKGAVILATKSWANELGEWEINVNAVAPGTVLTPMIAGLAAQQNLAAEETFEQFNTNNIFQGSRGHVTEDDIAKMVLYLATEDARMITGQVIAVDAGFSTS